jgi:hypothetical protein
MREAPNSGAPPDSGYSSGELAALGYGRHEPSRVLPKCQGIGNIRWAMRQAIWRASPLAE